MEKESFGLYLTMKYYNRTFVSFKGNNFFVLHLHNLHYSTCYYGNQYYLLSIFFPFWSTVYVSTERHKYRQRREDNGNVFVTTLWLKIIRFMILCTTSFHRLLTGKKFIWPVAITYFSDNCILIKYCPRHYYTWQSSSRTN